MADNLVFPWARSYDADQLAALIEDLWGAASGDNDLATLDAIEKVIAEHRPDPVPCPLTGREIQILTEVANGETYESAASNLGLGLETVRSCCATLYDRLGARCAAQAAAIAAHHGWLPGLRVTEPAERVQQLSPQAWKTIYRQRAAEMRKRPRQVVEIGPYVSRTGARNGVWRINGGLIAEFQPAGSFDAEAVRVDHGRWIVRARYIGTPVSPAQKAAS
jgi:DNA-binding CsgD family transcriptional regulator